ncbi:FAD-binding and (Fe-S)-binding domain-containing protein [Aestuariibacter sp. A3R04]|uniref:D-2-hydroxyglutarate dehydrogenase YdiJ n=1 Tax=Aestuariibacter sp. A3R04 TaxID=2841571 RepID=UPI001C090A21|nr:FAD-binding and (Fe-S)-binding domain-containing protein [Aestuariibacter sp. A3R04]MBU3022888.1 FAD-binding oxidoreductase [Aestuariibacter sp. A3R04]
MIPLINPDASLKNEYLRYVEALKWSNFSGDVEKAYSTRIAYSTDNSVYQKTPQAVVFPKNIEDLVTLGELAHKPEFINITFSARGGGTGTNGQSLTSGIIVDTSRHMKHIIDINTDERWVRVQAGVVKDQLNDFLKPHGFFFSPDLSTSNRATIGGMINTDASGQGSLVYGKTSDHVLGLTSVLVDGTILHTRPIELQRAKVDAQQATRIGNIYKQLIETGVGKRQLITDKFPPLNRFLTGYDLAHIVDSNMTSLDPSRVICGSEGSLVFVAEAILNITPIPSHKVLVNIKYDSFDSALRHAPAMVAAKATSVETVDSNVLNLAREDVVWQSVEHLIEPVPERDVQGLNMVEFNSEDRSDIEGKIQYLRAQLDREIEVAETGVIGYQITDDITDIDKIYAMRKKSVGLLGKTKSTAKPIAFAEDTAVPPEHLADFIMQFRQVLDSYQLHYGMFGHVDAGVLHVRPALDLCDPDQEITLRKISDEVVALVAKYRGLMWGEHGKGFRSEYGPEFFGNELFAELRKIKAVFDPYNKMNPGKICTPINSKDTLVSVDDKKRGGFDRIIPVNTRASFKNALNCNGNGLCFNYNANSTMCPSFKVSGDRRHSPKGRAGMLREWLRLAAQQGVNLEIAEKNDKKLSRWQRYKNNKSKHNDFSHEVLAIMNDCLACKACASQCPINVDVPDFRSRFFDLYYQRYSRPVKDYLVANIERMAPLLSYAPRLANRIMNINSVKSAIEKYVGYVDSPLLSSPTLRQRVGKRYSFNLALLRAMSAAEKEKTVIVVQDPFTSFYEAEVVHDALSALDKLGFNPVLLPFKPNGKPQHVKGFLSQFAKTASSTAAFLNEIATVDVALVGLDASLVLCYRDEYKKTLGEKRGTFNVALIQEWLIDKLSSQILNTDFNYKLLSHCTEKAMVPASEKQWRDIFNKLGVKCEIVPVGCCGMAGTYGHEKNHLASSKAIYSLSWQRIIESANPDEIMVTGYSCRSQVKRINGYKPKHPMQVILNLLE